MAPRTPKRTTVQHFTHIHPLTEFNSAGDFICDGCKTYGSGKTYRCEPCNYDLHDYCATCPLTLPIFIHPKHELSLVVRTQESTRQNERACDICNESVEGLFYRCKLCEFDVHPLCTKLPQHVRHVLHPDHQLEFSLGGASPCMVCYNPCQSWRYRCELCRFDIHMECILAVCNTSPPDKTEASGTKSKGLKPQGGQPSWSPPGQQPHVVYPYGLGPMGQQPHAGYPYGFGPMGPQPHFGNPYNAFGPMGQKPYHPQSFNNSSYMNGPMGQQPYHPQSFNNSSYMNGPVGQQPYHPQSFNNSSYMNGPMGQQPYHPQSFNNSSYMNGFNTNPGQVPEAEVPEAGADPKPRPNKGWRMFTIATQLTLGVVSTALFGIPLPIGSLFG